ncbi:MAG TPA: undecaprenyl-diphosphate phosphatase [Gemmatimonadales bacterium]|jgi:undecaprenyl-diphosphatase|nr:undecaprenyl-diphosphate phosphatase [Gemmatimonadales bacterium]
MTFDPLIIALLLGLVEGVTEFLPVSSTGHLIVAGHALGYTGQRADTFEIVIQVGAILAVVWHYRVLLADVIGRFISGPAESRLALNLLIAFIPAAAIGLALHHWITAHLFTPISVALALVIGGVIMLAFEWRRPQTTTPTVSGITRQQALGIGCAQVLSLIPGTSRSAATILGGFGLGLSRPAATEFSFLLAIPTLIAAGGYDIVKNRALFSSADVPMFSVGLVVSFIAALIVIRGFLRFVQSHSFVSFAWYRIVFGGLILGLIALHILPASAP